MNLRSVSTVALMAALAAPAFAQSAAASSDEESNLNLTLPTDEWYVPKNKITFGYRVLGSGIKANFGSLGRTSMRTIESSTVVAKPGTTTNETITVISRTYDNGSMRTDFQRGDELLTTTPGTPDDTTPAIQYGVYPGNGRYQVWVKAKAADGTISDTQISDSVSYQSGVTRYWGAANSSQIANDRVAMSTYGATSDGATAEKKEGMSGGLEFTLSRDMGVVGRRFQWGLTAGLALNNMNAKTGGTVHSTLNVHTDYYQLNGPAPTGSTIGGPTYVTLADHAVESSAGYETTTTIGDTPIAGASTDNAIVGGASLQGNWKVKGAYFMVRVGPTLRTQLSERFGLSASIGLAGAYAGSRYSVVETLEVPDVASITESIDNVENKFLGGFYADMNIDWVANERTGLFAGVNVQKLGSYDQEVGGRTAKIDFGSAVGIRGGMSFKF
jgi:hypothetical protein